MMALTDSTHRDLAAVLPAEKRSPVGWLPAPSPGGGVPAVVGSHPAGAPSISSSGRAQKGDGSPQLWFGILVLAMHGVTLMLMEHWLVAHHLYVMSVVTVPLEVILHCLCACRHCAVILQRRLRLPQRTFWELWDGFSWNAVVTWRMTEQ